MFLGMLVHIFIDVLFWFSPIDLLYPLSLSAIDITHPVMLWVYSPPTIVHTILTVSEPLCYCAFLIVLRWCVIKKLGKWTGIFLVFCFSFYSLTWGSIISRRHEKAKNELYGQRYLTEPFLGLFVF